MINVEVNRGNNENNANIIRKFTRRVQEAGILNRVRSLRYSKRTESPYVRKKKALKSIRRKEEVEKLIKLGKIHSREHMMSR
jgi:ribosomal protein S21